MKYFMMSTRFDKKTYEDFNLNKINDKFYDKNNSEWIPCKLYDFGWGNENGYYKVPLGDFETLINLVLSYDDDEDSYAASYIIETKYIHEFKSFVLDLIKKQGDLKTLRRLKMLFKLEISYNRTIENGLNLYDIENEYNDWKLISEFFQKI